MAQTHARWSDEWVEQAVGNLLRAGVILAGAVVLLGAVVYLLHHGGETVDYSEFKGEPPEMRQPAVIVAEASSLRGRALIQLGLLLLVATPVARVVFSVAAFALQRDRLYVLLTLIVLAILLYSLFGAGPEG